MSASGDHKTTGTSSLEFNSAEKFEDFINASAVKVHAHKGATVFVLPQINLKPELFSTLDSAWAFRLISVIIFSFASGSHFPVQNLKINAQFPGATPIQLTQENWKENLLKLVKLMHPDQANDPVLIKYYKIPLPSPKAAAKQKSTAALPKTAAASAGSSSPVSTQRGAEVKAKPGFVADSKFEHRMTAALAKTKPDLAVDSWKDDDSEIDRTPPTPPNTPTNKRG